MKNTVTISVEKYDELKEIERKSKEPRKHTVVVFESHGLLGYKNMVSTDKESVKVLAEELKTANERIKELENPKPKETTIQGVSEMSIWNFMKWRKEKNK